MDNRNSLLEQREDAAIALFMERYIRAESERLLRLNQSLSDSEPETVSRCLRRVRRAFFVRKIKSCARKMLRILPSALLALALVFSAAFWLVPEFHVAVLNVFMVFPPKMQMDSFPDPASTSAYLDSVELPFDLNVANGFILIRSEVSDDREYLQFQSETDPNILFSISASAMENTTMSYNTEGYLTRETIEINGHPADFFVAEGVNWIAWADPDTPCVVYLDSVNMSPDDFLAIVRSVRYTGD